MNNQKLENSLNLALDATPEEREKAPNLEIGYNPLESTWELIVKYTGDISRIAGENVQVVPLLGGYAILTLPEAYIQRLAELPEITFIGKPKRLFFAVNQGRAASCINPLQTSNSPLGPALMGRGVIVACVDSGIHYAHPDFCRADGTTRILSLWDQSVPGNPPEGYFIGTEYTQEQINEALRQETPAARYEIVPSRDLSGHGTGVMGIAAGNGRASQGAYRGVAPESDLIVVKLGPSRPEGFPRTTELMQGIDYVIRQGAALGRPVALNLSFGNNYGSHSGDSLLSTYIDSAAGMGKNVICVGTGNEGNRALHTSGVLEEGVVQNVQLAVSTYETGMNIQIWKSYVDQVEIALVHPNGRIVGPFQEILGPQRFTIGSTEILLYYGEPGPYSLSQEIYIELIPRESYLDSGVWEFRLQPSRIIEGEYHMWLPGGNVLNEGTRFYLPSPYTTLTIPSTAGKVISVGAYDSRYQSYADFFFFLYTRMVGAVKPDLAAPGVDIQTTAVGGGYDSRTGTSFATPFVTGSAALMMEWGIVNQNDPFLYGEKVKAYLRRGAKHLLGQQTWPNPRLGFGVLCLQDSFPV